MNNYVCYHLHSYYSLLDSCTSPKEYVEKAKELGQTSLAFTEHGNIFNWFEKKLLCESAGLKYLHGIECYMTENLYVKDDDGKDKKIRDNWHTILIAKDIQGFIQINRLFFASYHPDHKYYKTRISAEEFLALDEHVIKISACIQSPLWQLRKSIMNDSSDMVYKRKELYEKLLKHYDYYEIQAHIFEDQIKYNKFLYNASKKYNKPLIVGTDTHSLNPYKAECRTMLQYGKTDGLWGDEENTCDLSYKSYDEVVEMFRIQNSLPMDVVLEALNNTNIMAESVEVLNIDTHNKYPYLYGDNDEEVFKKTLTDNYRYKILNGIIPRNPQYKKNILEEMAVFKKTNMIGFMLFMSELMTWAKDNNIATGSARGSVAGSTVAYISNITDVDPVKWHTIFSRFCNEHRVEIGDIDTDWFEDDRQKIYDYIIDRFGTEKTGYVLAMGTLAEKSVIDVIGKAFTVKFAQENNISTTVARNHPDNNYRLDNITSIKAEFDTNPEETKSKYPELFYYYDGLCGCVVSQSQHPAGIIASPINLIDFCGAFLGEDGQQILPLDMDCCHDAGLVKYDVLGLKTVGVIDKTCKLLGKNYPKVHEIDFEDQAVYQDMTNDHTSIFQFESKFAGDCLAKMKCQNVFDLSLVNACIRPSGESYREKLLNREYNKNPSELIDKLLEKNYGWLIYQEDTLAFLQQICGFSGSDADNVRRAIGRKKVDVLNAALPKILDGYCSKSDKPREVAEQEAKAFLQVIEDSASYQFGFNHSVSYSIMSYLCGYYRHYYPVEYCTSFLNCAKNDDDIANGTDLVRSLNIKMADIKFRHSTSEYTCDSNRRIIYKGLSSIKYMSNNLADDLYALKDNAYDNFIQLLIDLKNTSCDARQLDILIKLDFFSEFGNPNQLLAQVKMFNDVYGKKQFKKDKCEIPERLMKKYAGKETEKMYTQVDTTALMYELAGYTDEITTSILERLKWSNELLGYLNITRPDWVDVVHYVQAIDGNWITLYRMKDGYSFKIKIRKNNFNKNPFTEGQLIKVLEIVQEKKFIKLEDGTWGRSEELEDILKTWSVIKE